MDPVILSRDDVIRMRESLGSLHDEVGIFLDRNGTLPASGSQLETEMRAFGRAPIMDAFSHANVLFEVVADHLTGLVKMLTEPVQTFAPGSCVRALLESASVSAWLLDSGIEGRTRVQRSLAQRYDGLKYQESFVRLGGRSDPVEAQRRIDALEKEALSLGFARVADKSGKRDGVAMKMEKATTLVDQMFGAGSAYRLLSAYVHGHHWAFAKLAFQVIESTDASPESAEFDLIKVKKRADPNFFGWLLIKAAIGFAKPVWFRTCLLGTGKDELAGILDRAADALRIGRAEERFWRDGISPSGRAQTV